MTPKDATHHELGPNGYAYYRADTTPHKKWTGLGWAELGRYADVTTWAVPLHQEAKIKPSSAANTFCVHSRKEWKYD